MASQPKKSSTAASPASSPKHAAVDAPKRKRLAYGHRTIDLGLVSELQAAAASLALGAKDVQNTATYLIRQVLLAHAYDKEAKAHVRRDSEKP